MTRLVKRHSAGGIAAIQAVGQIGQSIGNYFAEKAKAEKEKEIAAMNREQALAENQTAEWRAKAAAAASKFDRGEGAVTAAITAGLRTNPNVSYDNGATTPGYQAAAVPQTNPSVVNSGVLSGVVSSFFNKGSDDEDGAYAGTNIHDMSPDQQRKIKAEWRQRIAAREAGNLEGEVTAGGEQKTVTNTAGADVTSSPTGSPEQKDMKVSQEKAKTDAGKAVTGKVAAKNGCKLKKRFNPRQFKKQK